MPSHHSPRIASARIRCFQPVRTLRDQGYPVEVYAAPRSGTYRAVVFSKRLDRRSLRAAEALQRRGVRLAYDLCDNYLGIDAAPGSDLAERRAILLAFLALVDEVVVTCDPLGEAVRTALPTCSPTVIGDAVENDFGAHPWALSRWWGRRSLARLAAALLPERRRVVWFGNRAGAGGGGMADAASRRALLEGADAIQPLSLTVISNDAAEFARRFAGWHFPVHYLAWRADTFLEALQLHDLAWIPVTRNPFTICKSNNRLTQALHCGVAVAADAIPSYQPFANVCLLEPDTAALARYLADSGRRACDIMAARRRIAHEWTQAAIASRWRSVLDRLLAPPAALAVRFNGA